MSIGVVAAAALALVAGVGALIGWLGGEHALRAGLAAGGLAALTQIAAARIARGALESGFTRFLGAWALGIALRFAAVVLLAALMVALPGRFPPLASAFGFLGVLIPLLLLEIRLAR
ncbi:MAG TPA: hypothetical protein VFU46_11920 [Gemmatimonadales bacterium]|nr:hypothetical protein [Gemmatimonadales bacterium]